MTKPKIISLDFDGTIVDQRFAESVWLEGLPRLYAEKEKLSLEKAEQVVKREYNKVGALSLEWYDIKYWFSKFSLTDNWVELLKSYKSRINVYPEVPDVLRKLRSKNFQLIIISNAAREFLNFELEKSNVGSYFDHIFSSTSDFKMVKGREDLYLNICSILKVEPNEMTHVGDHWEFDFITPRRLGIKSFYLDRNGLKVGESVIRNLTELVNKLEIEFA